MLCVALLLASAKPAVAQQAGPTSGARAAPVPGVVASVGRPERVIAAINFEERQGGNVESLPMGWVKLVAPGMPHYVSGRLTRDAARSGDYSFRLDLDGGSAAYRHVLPERVFSPGTHYRVEVYARTTPLAHAACRLTAYFVDADGKPILETIVLSEPWAHRPDQQRPTDDWQRLSIALPAVDERCRRMVVELALVQPELMGSSRPRRQQLFEQDIEGSAWFDDLTVAQVPRMHVESPAAGNVFGLSEPLALTVVVSDEYTDDLSVSMRVEDATGVVVHQQTAPIPGAVSPSQSVLRRLTLRMPDLAPGWYRANLLLHNGQINLGQKQMDFIRLADDTPALLPDGRFLLSATHLPLETWETLVKILPRVGAGRVKLAVWTKHRDLERDAADLLDKTLQDLKRLSIVPTACLLTPPPQLRADSRPSSWGSLPTMPAEPWTAALALLVSRHAHHVPAWQIGSDEDAVHFVTDPNYRRAFELVRARFGELLQRPDLSMPWPVWFEPDAQMPAALSLLVPPEVLPEHIPLYIDEARRHGVKQVSVSLSPIDEVAYGRPERIADFAQRLGYALAGGADRLELPLPFDPAPADGQPLSHPQELLLVQRTLMMALGGSTYRGQVALADDAEALLFEKGGTGILLYWATRPGHPSNITVALGGKPYRLDLMGRRNALPETAQETDDAFADGRQADRAALRGVNAPLEAMPAMIVGVDPNLSRLRASVRFEQPRVESDFAVHERVLTLTNTFSMPISGDIRLAGPQGWRVQLEPRHFALQPGETYRGVARIQFPYNSLAGRKILKAHIGIRSDDWQAVEAPVGLELGLSEVGLQTLAVRQGSAIMVQQVITNYADRAIAYSAFVHVPGLARQERLVTDLEAGKTVIKRYRFEGLLDTGSIKFRSGLREMEGTRILNEEVELE
ncbi:MAG: hypothetical protein ACFCVE_00285 [Phycisphaerae bacterium]